MDSSLNIKDFNIQSIAKDVVENYARGFQYTPHVEYVNATLYVAIDNDDNIQVSVSPNILSNATEAIIILTRSELALNNYYRWYDIRHINSEGIVNTGYINGRFRFFTTFSGRFSDQIIGIEYDNNRLYSVELSPQNWLEKFKELWDMFIILKNCDTVQEMRYARSCFYNDITIKKLQQEISDGKLKEFLLEQEIMKFKSIVDRLENAADKIEKVLESANK